MGYESKDIIRFCLIIITGFALFLAYKATLSPLAVEARQYKKRVESVKVGMNKTEVYSLMGEPLRTKVHPKSDSVALLYYNPLLGTKDSVCIHLDKNLVVCFVGSVE